jgi:hypothetical protein
MTRCPWRECPCGCGFYHGLAPLGCEPTDACPGCGRIILSAVRDEQTREWTTTLSEPHADRLAGDRVTDIRRNQYGVG